MKAKKRKQVGLTTQIETAYIKSENTIGDQKYNDKDIDSLEDLKTMLEKENSKFSRFDFLYGITPLILPTEMMKEENTQLLKKYNIGQSFWFGNKNEDGATSNWR